MSDVNKGFVYLHRKIIDSDIWDKPPMYFKVFQWLILKAQHRDYMGLKRGQLRTSISEIQTAMSYKVGFILKVPSRKQIWQILDYLRNSMKGIRQGTMVETRKVTSGLVVTICKYDTYQSKEVNEGNTEGNTVGNTAGEQQDTIMNNNENNKTKSNFEKKGKINKEISPEAQEVLCHLNQVSGKRFATIGLIQERLNSGRSVADCKRVIDIKWADPKFDKNRYFNHTSLFRPDNFDKYLNENPEYYNTVPQSPNDSPGEKVIVNGKEMLSIPYKEACNV